MKSKATGRSESVKRSTADATTRKQQKPEEDAGSQAAREHLPRRTQRGIRTTDNENAEDTETRAACTRTRPNLKERRRRRHTHAHTEKTAPTRCAAILARLVFAVVVPRRYRPKLGAQSGGILPLFCVPRRRVPQKRTDRRTEANNESRKRNRYTRSKTESQFTYARQQKKNDVARKQTHLRARGQ